MIELKAKRTTVTGGNGFLGKHLVRKLREDRGCENVLVADLPEYDLRDISHIRRMFDEQRPEIVIHLAAVVGGIGANQARPGTFFYENAIMGIQLVHEAYLHGIEKLVLIGTACSYPKNAAVPFKEEDLWNGYPEETNAPYGLAKKMLLVQSQAYRKQYGFNSIFLMLTNLYGPGDNFDSASSHVIAALIRKCVEAKAAGAHDITVWGTGRASREFLYVEDAAEGIILASEKYDEPEPMNLGSGFEIAMDQLVEMIREITGFDGQIQKDASKPDGQPRGGMDTSQALRKIGFMATTPLDKGLGNTIEWFTRANKP